MPSESRHSRSTLPPAGTRPPPPAALRAPRLIDLLRQAPDRTLEAIIRRVGISVDGSKRIDTPSQVARVLLLLPELRDPSVLAGPTRELLFRLAEARGVLEVDRVPAAAEVLVGRGVVHVHTQGKRLHLLLPIAFMLQLRAWEGDDPRGVRALLAQLSPEVANQVAAEYLGRPPTPPLTLALEAAWEALTDPEHLTRALGNLPPAQRQLLRSIEELGGEVDTHELLELERDPLRLRGSVTAGLSRRSLSFHLERLGYLLPLPPARHVIPTEVAAVFGAARRAGRESRRREIEAWLLAADVLPRRARYAVDPAPVALAMALAVREPGVEVRAEVGTPRSLLARLSTRFGQPPEQVALLAALSRAAGLWDPSAASDTAPPGSRTVGTLSKDLFLVWRRGGAWDEAREDGEVLRARPLLRDADARPSGRDPSPTAVVRELVMEALGDLAVGCWVPLSKFQGYLADDQRADALRRLLARWAQRTGAPAPTLETVVERVVTLSLHGLGVVDLGEAHDDEGAGDTVVRLSQRGREWLGDREEPDGTPSAFMDGSVLRVGGATRIATLMAAGAAFDIAATTPALDLAVNAMTVARAFELGFEADALQERLRALAPLPEPLTRLLRHASTVIGRGQWMEAQGFLWIEDVEVRELLRTRRQTADLFVDPSPPGGLLVQAGVDLDRLARRCRLLGVELLVGGEPFRARGSSSRPASPSGLMEVAGTPRTGPPRRRRSAEALPAVDKRGR